MTKKKTILLVAGLTPVLLFTLAVGKPAEKNEKPGAGAVAHQVNTSGFHSYGEIIKEWEAGNAHSYLPIDLKNWRETPAASRRLPSLKETEEATGLHHYQGKTGANVRPHDIQLPRLAWYSKFDKKDVLIADHFGILKYTKIDVPGIVVVVQVVTTPGDTIVAFRYPGGGAGGSLFRNFRFLNDQEVEHAVKDYMASRQRRRGGC